MEVFELSEVAEILAVPKARIKNWTIGRPLRIRPSVRAATRKGTRNLYSVEDVYLMGLADQLRDDGFAPETIQAVLKKIRRDVSRIGSHYSELVVSNPGGGAKITFLGGDMTKEVWEECGGADAISRYTLDLKAVREWIDSRIAKIRKRQQG